MDLSSPDRLGGRSESEFERGPCVEDERLSFSGKSAVDQEKEAWDCFLETNPLLLRLTAGTRPSLLLLPIRESLFFSEEMENDLSLGELGSEGEGVMIFFFVGSCSGFADDVRTA